MCSSAYITTAHSRGVSTVEGEKHCPTFFHTDLAAALERREQGGSEGPLSVGVPSVHVVKGAVPVTDGAWSTWTRHQQQAKKNHEAICVLSKGFFTSNVLSSLHFSFKSGMYEITYM